MIAWEQTRALEALLDIAFDALQASIAVCPDDEDRELIATFKDQIHTAHAALVPARDLLQTMAMRATAPISCVAKETRDA